MSLTLVRSGPLPQPVRISIPAHLWDKLVEMTPPEFSVEDTIIVAVTDFVEQEAINTAGSDQCSF